MADKRIQDLTPATTVEEADRFVLEQSGQAKSLTGEILKRDLAAMLDGHGGIASITWTESGTTGDGKTHTGTITFADGTTSTIVFNDGVKGDTGAQTYVHFRWADEEPDSDSDILTTPSNWIGVYSGLSETAPTAYTDYVWYEYKGAKGDTGNNIVNITRTASSGIVDTYTVFMDDGNTYDFTVTNGVGINSISKTSTSGLVDTYTVSLSDGSSAHFDVTNGNGITSIEKTGTNGLVDTYTVTMTNGSTTTFTVTNAKSIDRIVMTSGSHAAGTTDTYTIYYNDGDTASFSVYNGANGTGAVSTVSGIQADGNGDVPQIISGNGAPTTTTVGQTNQLYFDLNEGVLYYCIGESEGTYSWSATTMTVDDALSTTSPNPVRNSVITNKVGTTTLNTTAQNLSGAVNEVLAAIPDSTSDLTNDSGFITAAQIPVTSVNGDTGAVSTWYKVGNSASSYPSTYGRYAVTANIFSNIHVDHYYGLLTIEAVGNYQRHMFESSWGEVWVGWRESATVAEPTVWNQVAGGIGASVSQTFASTDSAGWYRLAVMDNTITSGVVHIHVTGYWEEDLYVLVGRNYVSTSNPPSITIFGNTYNTKISQFRLNAVSDSATYLEAYITPSNSHFLTITPFLTGWNRVYGVAKALSSTTGTIYATVKHTAGDTIETSGKVIAKNTVFSAGETLTLSSSTFAGHFRATAKMFEFTVPVQKSLANISSISCSTLTGWMLGVSGDCESSTSSGYKNWKTTSYTVTATKRGDSMISVLIEKSSAFTNAVNLTPGSFYCGSIVFSFS